MMRSVCVLLALACAAHAARLNDFSAIRAPAVGEWVKPWYCHDLDCPHFTSVKNVSLAAGTLTVELRSYKPAKWVSTVVESDKYDKAVATGFFRLFKYISGENAAETKVEMTAPVTVKVVPGAGPECNSNFTISFYIPDEHQANPPEPTNEYVHLTDMPAMDAYVYGFGGFATGNKWVDTGASVTTALQEAGYSISQDFYFGAAYDSPFRLLNRHNEVWIPAAAAPAPEPSA